MGKRQICLLNRYTMSLLSIRQNAKRREVRLAAATIAALAPGWARASMLLSTATVPGRGRPPKIIEIEFASGAPMGLLGPHLATAGTARRKSSVGISGTALLLVVRNSCGPTSCNPPDAISQSVSSREDSQRHTPTL
jgi:hypothetical protein